MTQKVANKILVASSADGWIYYWHVKSGKLLYTINESPNDIYCLDYDRTYSTLASAGKDLRIRLYDEKSKSPVHIFEPAGDERKGHSNRIFAVKFHPDNGNLLLSGGWDNTLLLWDVRTPEPVDHFLGPNISGESIDMLGSQILAGSWTDEANLRIFDMRKASAEIWIDWFGADDETEEGVVPSWVYSAMFSKPHENYIIAAGAAKNEVRLFRNEDGYKGVAKVTGIKAPCLSIDWNNFGNKFAIGCANGTVHSFTFSK